MYLLTISPNLLIYMFLDIDLIYMYLIYFVIWCSNKSFSNNSFSFIKCWIHLYIVFHSHYLIDHLKNLLDLSTHIMFGLQIDSSRLFKSISTCSAFFIFQNKITRAYLLKISITHNKNRIKMATFFKRRLSIKLWSFSS